MVVSPMHEPQKDPNIGGPIFPSVTYLLLTYIYDLESKGTVGQEVKSHHCNEVLLVRSDH